MKKLVEKEPTFVRLVKKGSTGPASPVFDLDDHQIPPKEVKRLKEEKIQENRRIAGIKASKRAKITLLHKKQKAAYRKAMRNAGLVKKAIMNALPVVMAPQTPPNETKPGPYCRLWFKLAKVRYELWAKVCVGNEMNGSGFLHWVPAGADSVFKAGDPVRWAGGTRDLVAKMIEPKEWTPLSGVIRISKEAK